MKKSSAKEAVANRFVVFNAFIDFTASGLRRSEILVWLTLFRDTRDGVARSSQTSIAKRCGVSRKTVERAIRELEGRELLSIVRRGGLNQGPSSYRVLPINREQLTMLN
jgi:DNA-binding MarR family transcriptional regulator